MSKQIEIVIKSVYGRPLNYPKCEQAKLFASLLKVKTFTSEQLEGIKALGYEVKTSMDFVNY